MVLRGSPHSSDQSRKMPFGILECDKLEVVPGTGKLCVGSISQELY